jgi:Tfp pilus assembly protein PilF
MASDGLIGMNSGEYFFRKGNYELALSYFQKALTKNPNSYIAYSYIVIIHLRSSNIRLATYFLDRSIQVTHGSPNAYLLIGALYLQLQKYALASDYANAILEVYHGNVDTHLMSGIALYLQEHFDTAKHEFDVADVLDPQNPSAKVFRALIELEQHHLKEAEKYISVLVSSVTEKIFLQAQILQERRIETLPLQQQLGRYVDAAHDPVAWLILGHIYYSRADYGLAEAAYRYAMAARRANVLPYYAMAQLEAVRANRRQAIAYLNRSI